MEWEFVESFKNYLINIKANVIFVYPYDKLKSYYDNYIPYIFYYGTEEKFTCYDLY